MAAAPRRPEFEGDGESKPRNRRTYQKPAKEKPFGRPDREDRGPKSRKKSFAEDDDDFEDDLDEDFDDDDDLDVDDLDEDELDFEDLDDDFDGGWDDDSDDDR